MKLGIVFSIQKFLKVFTCTYVGHEFFFYYFSNLRWFVLHPLLSKNIFSSILLSVDPNIGVNRFLKKKNTIHNIVLIFHKSFFFSSKLHTFSRRPNHTSTWSRLEKAYTQLFSTRSLTTRRSASRSRHMLLASSHGLDSWWNR